jgi:hypothetical protein
MKVPNILSGLGDLTSKAKKTDSDAAPATGAMVAANSATPPSAAASMREIVSRYDMTDISPNDFSSMIQQLYAKGAISSKDMQELSSIRGDLESAGIGADQAVNLQDFYQQRLAKAKVDAAQSADPAAAQANIQSLASRMTWVQKFAAVGQEENSVGVNAVA